MIIFSLIIFIEIKGGSRKKRVPNLLKNRAHDVNGNGVVLVYEFGLYLASVEREWMMKLMVVVKSVWGWNKERARTKDIQWRSSKVNRKIVFLFSLNLNQFSQFNCKIRLEQVENVEITIIRKHTRTHTHIACVFLCARALPKHRAHLTIVGDGFAEWKALKIYGINHANKLKYMCYWQCEPFSWSSAIGDGGGGAQIL